MKAYLKILMVGCGGLTLVIAFQNCGQPGGINPVETSLSSKAEAPLVVDVVTEIEREDGAANDNVADNETPDDTQEYTPPQVEAGNGNKDKDKEEQPHRDHQDEVGNIDEVLVQYACGDEEQQKVMICHYPPGNAAARHNLCIGISALKAHMDHGHSGASHQDRLGSCENPEEDQEQI